MNSSDKKEVSCKALDSLFNALKINNLDESILLQGIPYDLPYLKNKNERIEWSAWCKIISNLRPFFSYSDFERMGSYVITSGNYFIGVFIAYFLFSTSNFSKVMNKQLFKLVGSTFSCINQKTQYLDSNRIKVTGSLDDGYEFCPEFWHISKGTWQQSALAIGRKSVVVDLTFLNNKAVFDVSWAKESLFFRLKLNIQWLFNVKKAFMELTESYQTLTNQYELLDESKKTLVKQATQLKTVHEISTSIRPSLTIKEALNVITSVLVKEAEFCFASIKIFKNLDNESILIKSEIGKEIEYVSPIQQKIFINDIEIGDLIVQPKLGMEYKDIYELLKHLSPVINIAIHDSLVLSDITDYRDNLEQKVANRTFELQKARDDLAEINKLLNEAHQTQNRFFTNISHEFRTPLTLILGPAKQLLEQSKDDKTKTEADFIYRNAKKLNRLVDELLDISRIEAGEMKLKTCSFNLVSIVKENILYFHSLAERNKIILKLNIAESKILVFVDKNKIEKILGNVLSNAFKFTPQGGKVEVEVSRKEKFAEIAIIDTGIGISQQRIDKIFDRFYQVDGSNTREKGGTGIGLSLTKELVELHKGRIEVISEEGRGSTFKIFFPLGKEHLKPEEICEEEIITNNEQEKIISNFDELLEIENRKEINSNIADKFGKTSLLIIDDNRDVRNYIKSILENEYNISEACNGEEGLNKSFKHIPDLIISDVMMPKLDGFKLCEILKTDTRTSHIPLIMLTAKSTMHDKISGLELGADEYIMKPFEALELKARIQNLLVQRKRLHKHFHKYGIFEFEGKTITSVDQKFLQNAIRIITEHIADTEFSVEKFADEMAVSRSLLLKKIVALVGCAPRELIKSTRLNKSVKLIESNFGNISEIALEVGFNNPSYFAECFKKQFGISPSNYPQNSTII